MPSSNIDEFASLLVKHVRDVSVRSCDALLRPGVNSAIAKRWRTVGAASSQMESVIPDVVDEVLFSLLNAIDQEQLPIKFVNASGSIVDLAAEGMGELGGWYMGSGGWRKRFSQERHFDDFADMR